MRERIAVKRTEAMREREDPASCCWTRTPRERTLLIAVGRTPRERTLLIAVKRTEAMRERGPCYFSDEWIVRVCLLVALRTLCC